MNDACDRLYTHTYPMLVCRGTHKYNWPTRASSSHKLQPPQRRRPQLTSARARAPSNDYRSQMAGKRQRSRQSVNARIRCGFVDAIESTHAEVLLDTRTVILCWAQRLKAAAECACARARTHHRRSLSVCRKRVDRREPPAPATATATKMFRRLTSECAWLAVFWQQYETAK